jgi:hypothetical protein
MDNFAVCAAAGEYLQFRNLVWYSSGIKRTMLFAEKEDRDRSVLAS